LRLSSTQLEFVKCYGGGVKSYGQYCALARALDVIGDRWSPLIVRELLGGARRYGELLEGLPGIATNLLAERLRHLEAAGVVERDEEGRYRLSEWGEGLREPLYALARWGAPVTMSRGVGDDTFRSEWLVHPVNVLFEGADARRGDMTVEVRIGEKPMTIESRRGQVTVHPGAPPSPDVALAGPADIILGLLAGQIDPDTARQLDVDIQGDGRRLRHLRPRPGRAPLPSDTGVAGSGVGQ
jgi:DNA-binding HxlR family transcriptional regulator